MKACFTEQRIICKSPVSAIRLSLTDESLFHRTENQMQKSCLCYQIITGTAPEYLADLVKIYVPSRSLRSSSDNRTFRIPTFNRKQHGGRAFCFYAVQTWNSLPFAFHHSPSHYALKTGLKTHLFIRYFDQLCLLFIYGFCFVCFFDVVF